MTISYSGNFTKLLLRWKGSIWKSIWKEFGVFLILYYIIRIIYRYALDEQSQVKFEYIVLIFNEYTKSLPLTFLLGFYIATVVKRWWDQFLLIAWPDDLLSWVCALIPGEDEQSKLTRHTIARYLNLTAALAWRDVSIKVRKRFPVIDNLVTAGLLTENERTQLQSIKVETVHWFIPLQWIQKIMVNLRKEGKIDPPLLGNFIRDLNTYRSKFRQLYCYDWVCIPLVYTQVAALATYGYFAFCLIGRQWLIPEKRISRNEIDLYFPIFTAVQFLFYVGWFKVGQDLMRPFGTDDDDIELNYILDRNVKVSFAIVHSVAAMEPICVPDAFWEGQPDRSVTLPHTKLSFPLRNRPPKLHSYIKVKNPSDADIMEKLEAQEKESKHRRLF